MAGSFAARAVDKMSRAWPRALALALFAALLTLVRPSGADQVVVPLELQAELLGKVASYDRNMSARAGDRLQVLLLTKPSDSESVRVVSRMQSALRALALIGGLPHDEQTLNFTTAADLARHCRAQHIAILFLGPGHGDDLPAIREALDNVDVLSVSAVPEYVQRGVVLGFDVVSGKPRLLVNLAQARRQHVALRAEVLKLMKVYDE
jgi:YfiR/HmsC-like